MTDPRQTAAALSEAQRQVLLHTLGLTHGDDVFSATELGKAVAEILRAELEGL